MEWMDHTRTSADERQERLSAWLDGELDTTEQAAVAAHLEGCDECQRALADLHAVRAVLHALPTPALPRSFELPDDLPLEPVVAATTPAPAAPIPFPGADEVEINLPEQNDERAAAFVASAPGVRALRRQRQPYWLRAARATGGLVAVLGLFLLMASAVLNQPGTNSAASTAAPRSSTTSQGNQSPSSPVQGTQGHAPTKNPHGAQTTPAAPPSSASVSPLLVAGLILLALGIVLLAATLIIRRRQAAAPPPATAPPGA